MFTVKLRLFHTKNVIQLKTVLKCKGSSSKFLQMITLRLMRIIVKMDLIYENVRFFINWYSGNIPFQLKIF